MLDAVVTAGGRLTPPAARIYGTDVKALVRVGGRTMLAVVVDSLRATGKIRRVVVVGPAGARAAAPDVDRWIDEYPTGEENLVAALRAASTERIVFSASDLPLVTPASYAGLIARAPAAAGAAYPIYRKDEFLRAYPAGRARFARLADGEWTGGSAFVLGAAPMMANIEAVRRCFTARKSVSSLAALLGPGLLIKFLAGRLAIADVERRASSVLGTQVAAVREADPALAMDCDDAADLAYVRASRIDAPVEEDSAR